MEVVIRPVKATGIFMSDIEALDLEMIKMKLQDNEEGPGWSRTLCDEAEVEYKRFLALKRLYPEKEVVPNKVIDQFWHQHILDTEKYAKDCELLFGRFIHHYPYFGMNGAEDAQNLVDAFDETKRIYKRHFGENFQGFAKRCKAPKCRTQCKPMKCR
jgi:hypothetical protein